MGVAEVWGDVVYLVEVIRVKCQLSLHFLQYKNTIHQFIRIVSFYSCYVNNNSNKMQKNPQTPPRMYEQFKKIFCAYHNTQFLTNFCVHKSCLMPLCPSCIVDHTQQHYREPSKPLYMNLHEALYDAKESCIANIHEFQDFALRLREMSEFKKKLVQEVHNQLVEHKQNIYTHIQRLFMQYEHDVYNIVVADYEELGLYREDDINQVQLRVHDTINELYDKIGMIKGEQCLAALIMYYGEEREKIGEVKGDCEKFIAKHDNSKIDTQLDDGAVRKQLEGLFENVIQIQKIDLNKRYQPIQQNRTPEKNNMNNSAISQSRRSRIFNQSGSNSKYVSPPKPMVQAPMRKSAYR